MTSEAPPSVEEVLRLQASGINLGIVEQQVLAAEVERLRAELARYTTCHVCGDCLLIPDGRCEAHCGMEPGDIADEECGCVHCKAAVRAAEVKK